MKEENKDQDLDKKHIAVWLSTHAILTKLASKGESYADIVERLLRQAPEFEKEFQEYAKARDRIPILH